ncbi:hypothetical protein BSK63_17475 [Paenibacillus odorifer]|uniref:hypothetical protein n=1 Tax=Paenibacillus odorifer TaxID=189426 RepID=UPI00096FFB92|nr:hypothetical protein [Paenibacillus odorifer]OME30683.1 hypothetical protein BSK63_17475 [Paenibacillus odorifer]
MDYIIKLAFAFLIFMFTWFFQVQNQEWDVNRSLLKDANNMAVHDAAQEINEDQRSHGLLIINPTEAYTTFKETLQKNLGLDSELSPLEGSRFHDKVNILEFVIIDESSSVSFPYLYEDQRYGITKYIQGPSVIAVIETKHPQLLASGKVQEPIQVPAVQEYKYNE